jgi:phage-related protein
LAGSAKPIEWVGSSRDDLRDFPGTVRRNIGQALYEAQLGGKSPMAKPLSGFGGAGTLEVVEDHDGNTFRAVYTVKLAGVVYVLHAFQKKAKRGAATPRRDLDLIRSRMKLAVSHHRTNYAAESG